MRMKRSLALLLAGATLGGLLTIPAAAAGPSKAPSAAFTDIYDAEVAEAAEVLRLLGIVNGTGAGTYEPDRVLSRAEFCKLAVELMGNGDKVAGQMNRTVFKDVPSTHWARGYINVATQPSSTGSGENASTTPGIIRGDESGNFHPDEPITYSAAVTILMRILGYADTDVGFGGVWYDGYLSVAASEGLTEGLALAPTDTLTRGQTALLMENLLYTEKKGAEEDYLTVLGGSITEDAQLILSVDAGDGKNEIKTDGGRSYKSDRGSFPSDLVGRKAKFVLDKDKKVLALQADDEGSYRTVNLAPGELTYLKSDTGEEIKVAKDAVVWLDGEQKTYAQVYQNDIRSGDKAILHYSAAGELQYIFLVPSDVKDDTAMVAKNKPSGNPFGALTAGANGYRIYKNGVPAQVEDIRQYDTAVYDKGAKVLYVSDLRITGVYEDVYPNAKAPATVTVLGHAFPILDSAVADLSGFKLGDTITILLTYNGKVAGVVSPEQAKSTTVGVVTKLDRESGYATVEPLAEIPDENGKQVTFEGKTSYTKTRADSMQGQLVTVSSTKTNALNLSRLTGSGSKEALDLSTGKMGSVALADNVHLYERVGTGKPQSIELDQITRGTVPADKILYVHKDSAGKADIVVFEDATGDLYQYGYLKYTPGEITEGVTSGRNATLAVENSTNKGESGYALGQQVKSGRPGGVAPSLEVTQQGETKLAGYVLLEELKDVKSSAFDMDAQTVSVGSTVYPVSDYVECYNKITKNWFKVPEGGDALDALNAARAFSETLTLYYDKAPEDGGKIRLVVVE